MTSNDRLKLNWEFRRAYTKGKSVVTPAFVIYVVKNSGHGVRLGIKAGTKLGCAVKRNRAKRVLTAAFSQCLPNIRGSYDIVLVARHKILSQKSTQVQSLLGAKLTEIGIYE